MTYSDTKEYERMMERWGRAHHVGRAEHLNAPGGRVRKGPNENRINRKSVS